MSKFRKSIWIEIRKRRTMNKYKQTENFLSKRKWKSNGEFWKVKKYLFFKDKVKFSIYIYLHVLYTFNLFFYTSINLKKKELKKSKQLIKLLNTLRCFKLKFLFTFLNLIFKIVRFSVSFWLNQKASYSVFTLKH